MEFFDIDMYDEILDKYKSDEEMLDCRHDNRFIDGHYTCILCGVVDMNRTQFLENIQQFKSYFIYSRKSYFREKLRLLTCIKQPTNAEYDNIIAILKEHQFDTIFELKKLMRKLKMSIYYKFIYCIFFDLKKVKLFPLTINEIEKLIHQFILLERQFKIAYPNKHNLLSYNIVIYCILKKNNYECHKYIILPKNRKKILKIVEDLVKLEKNSEK